MSKKKSYMNNQNIITESMLEKLFGLLLKGRLNKVRKMFDDNPHLQRATKEYKKAQDRYVKQLKNSKVLDKIR